MKAQIEVEGLKEFNKALKRVNDDMPKAMTNIHKALAEPIAKKAAAKAPKKSGQLASSIRALSSQKSAAVAAGKKRVPYAAVIHWGYPKRGIRPQPFMTEAIQSMEKKTVEEYQKMLDEIITEALQKGTT